jgi:hypothetical protein
VLLSESSTASMLRVRGPSAGAPTAGSEYDTNIDVPE